MATGSGTGTPASVATYATLAELKTELGITTTTDDTMLTARLEEATAAIDVHTGRTFYAATATAKTLDAVRDVDGRTLLVRDDLASITAVVNGDGVTITSGYYVTEPRTGTPIWGITLKTSSPYVWTYTTDPENAISITGYWAYSQTPSDDIRRACYKWAAQMYRAKDAQTIEAAFVEQGLITVQPGIPKDVAVLLRPYRRVT